MGYYYKCYLNVKGQNIINCEELQTIFQDFEIAVYDATNEIALFSDPEFYNEKWGGLTSDTKYPESIPLESIAKITNATTTLLAFGENVCDIKKYTVSPGGDIVESRGYITFKS